MHNYLFLLRLINKKSLTLLLLTHIIISGFNVFISYLLQVGISAASSGHFEKIMHTLVWMILGVVIYIAFYLYSALLLEKICQKLSATLSNRLLKQFLSQSDDQTSTGKVLNLINEDVAIFSASLTTGLLPLLDFSLSVIYGLVYLVFFSLPYGLIFILISLIFYYLSQRFFRLTTHENQQYLTQNDTHKFFLEEVYRGFPVLISLQVLPWLMHKHQQLFDQKKPFYYKYINYVAENQALLVGGVYIAEIITILLGFVLVHFGMFTTSVMLGLWNAGIGSIFFQFLYLPYTLDALSKQDTAYARVVTYLAENDTPTQVPTDTKSDQITLTNVSFAYPNSDQQVFSNYSLTLLAKQLYFMIGKNGVGKTTLLRLIAGNLVPTSGEIDFSRDRASVASLGSEQISFVSQKSLLFSTTLLENLTLGNPNISQPDIQVILEKLDLWDRVLELPQQLDSPVSPSDFSIGQLRRLAIARALLEDKPFIFLDEPFSDLDQENQASLLQLLRTVATKRGVIIIAHTFDLIEPNDHIIQLNGGPQQ